MTLLLFLGLLLIAGEAQTQCDSTDAACQAFVYAYPIWTSAGSRWGQSAGWAPLPNLGVYTGQASQFFFVNRVAIRRARLPTFPGDVPPLTLCTAGICSGKPHTLNPGPIVAPNVDTLYGNVWFDLINPCVLSVPNAAGSRYYSISFLDMYMNNVDAISNSQSPNGGLWCLIFNAAQNPICASALANLRVQRGDPNLQWTGILTIPKFSVGLIRVWSSGVASPPNACGVAAPSCGPDGCCFISNIGTAPITSNTVADFYHIYGPMMAPYWPTPSTTGPTCPYKYGEPPCGAGSTFQQRSLFWDAVCTVLRQSPPSAAEIAYVNAKFGAMGFAVSACTPATLNYTALDAGFTPGYKAVKAGEEYLGILGHQHPNEWLVLPYNGTWDISEAGFFLRAVSSSRLHWLGSNAASAYWAAYTDSRPPKQRSRLSCANKVTYRVKFNDGVVPVDYGLKGFWSITVYDPTWFLFSSTDSVYSQHGNTDVVPESFYISANCSVAPSPCVQAPAGDFQLLLRGYRPLAGLSPDGDYQLPKIQKCKDQSGKGC